MGRWSKRVASRALDGSRRARDWIVAAGRWLLAYRRIVVGVLGLFVGAWAAHFAHEVLWHGEQPWASWLTVGGAAAGFVIFASGRRRARFAMPAAAGLMAVGLSVAVFDLHTRQEVEYTIALAMDPASPAFADADPDGVRSLSGEVRVVAFRDPIPPQGCGPVRLSISGLIEIPGYLAVERGAEVGFLLFVSHDADQQVRLQTPTDPAQEIVTRVDPPDPDPDVTFRFAQTVVSQRADVADVGIDSDEDQAIDALSYSLDIVMPTVAVPRGVGSCFISFPHVGAHAADDARLRYVVSTPSVGYGYSTNRRNVVLRGETQPAPTGSNEDGLVWRCGSTATNATRQERSPCRDELIRPVVAEQAPWRPAFRDLALILIGTLISVVVELLVRWSDGRTRRPR